MRYVYIAVCSFLLLGVCASGQALEVGVGRVEITPEEPIWMGGYASRKGPSEGVLHPLWAKVLLIQGDDGQQAVIITTDLITIPAALAQETSRLLEEAFAIPRDRIMVTASHTHSSPALGDRLVEMYGMAAEERARVEAYSDALPGKLFAAVEQARKDLEPVRLDWGNGHTDFAGNRRKYTVNGVINNYNAIGPVDHAVPTLRVTRPDGSLKSVLFGYACHNTCTSFMEISGDYAGFAQLYLEEQLPGTTAMFVSGCGGDQNPLPRRTLLLAQLYGETLGRAVIRAIESPMTPVAGALQCGYEEIPLKLSEAPPRETIEADLNGDNIYKQRRAKHLLKVIEEEGALPTEYPYPVQVWKFDEGPMLTALGGEVTVDYALRIKKEFGADNNFVIAYANDVCAYIPSLRVLREGGYEGGDSMVYYLFHGPWAQSIEEDIMASVHRLSQRKPLINLHDAKGIAARVPLRIAHRGGVIRPESPECSRRAIALASDHGYDLVELDVQMSKDGEPVVFHDRNMKKACGVDGTVQEYTARAMADIPLRNGEGIMHLEEALALCKTYQLGVMLDFKTDGNDAFFRRVLGLLQRFQLLKSTCSINGAPAVREALGGHIMLRLTEKELNDAEASYKGYFWFGLPQNLDRDQIKPMQERGALVIPGINIFRYDAASHMQDAQQDIEQLKAQGVDGFQIDSVYNDFILQ